jgi:hypothetical protein
MYVMQPGGLSDEEVARLVALSARVDLKPGPGGSRITPLDGCDAGYWATRIGALRWQAAQFVALYPSSQLVAHCDPPIRGRRFHVPVQVNDGCWVFHGGTWQQLEVGRIYEMDPTVVHGAVNWGDAVRLHLIIDTESACRRIA